MKTTFLLFLHLIVVATDAKPLKGTKSAKDNDVEKVEDEHRQLVIVSNTVCPYGGGTVFFNVETTVVPGVGATGCNDASLALIGEMINTNLVSAGITEMPGTTFVSGYCAKPLYSTIWTNFRRKLQGSGFIWKGGGGCKGCNPDNGDGRRLRAPRSPTSTPTLKPSIVPTPLPTSQAAVLPTPPPAMIQYSSFSPILEAQTLFTNTFIAETGAIEARVDAAVTADLVNFPCMGTSPQVIVIVQLVQTSDQIHCATKGILDYYLF